MDFKEYAVKVVIKNGLALGSNPVKLPVGHLLGVAAYVQSELDPGVFINVGIKDDSGVSENKPTDVRNWGSRQGGSFHQSYKPFNEEITGLNYIFEATTANNAPLNNGSKGDVTVQFILYYKKQTSTCKI